MELLYAESFSVDLCQNGCALITMRGGERFLVVPESLRVPEDAPPDAVILKLPLVNVLISSTPAMSLINAIGALDAVTMTTTDLDSWYLPGVREAMKAGDLRYVGHYTEPDYETIYAKKPSLAVFSSMLDSSPEVAEKLTELDVTLLRDLSTYEKHPLARVEWVKLYGLLFAKEAEASAVFNAQVEAVNAAGYGASPDISVAVFYITSKGEIMTRHSDDYLVKMIELAGAKYVFDALSPGETGIFKMEQELFYAGAKDADIIIYIHNMGQKPESIARLVELKPSLADFRAVKNKTVWCTTPDFFQAADKIGDIIADMRAVFTAEEEELTYLFRLT